MQRRRTKMRSLLSVSVKGLSSVHLSSKSPQDIRSVIAEASRTNLLLNIGFVKLLLKIDSSASGFAHSRADKIGGLCLHY